MHVFDASSIINAWDNYPIEQFPALWDWIAEQIEEDNLAFPQTAYNEVKKKSPECEAWLKCQSVIKISTDNAIMQEAFRIKELLGILGDNYGAGVGENDLLIIATAKIHNGILVSNESIQTKLPAKLENYKIPAVCNMVSVKVPCVNFITFLKESKSVFR